MKRIFKSAIALNFEKAKVILSIQYDFKQKHESLRKILNFSVCLSLVFYLYQFVENIYYYLTYFRQYKEKKVTHTHKQTRKHTSRETTKHTSKETKTHKQRNARTNKETHTKKQSHKQTKTNIHIPATGKNTLFSIYKNTSYDLSVSKYLNTVYLIRCC